MCCSRSIRRPSSAPRSTRCATTCAAFCASREFRAQPAVSTCTRAVSASACADAAERERADSASFASFRQPVGTAVLGAGGGPERHRDRRTAGRPDPAHRHRSRCQRARAQGHRPGHRGAAPPRRRAGHDGAEHPAPGTDRILVQVPGLQDPRRAEGHPGHDGPARIPARRRAGRAARRRRDAALQRRRRRPRSRWRSASSCRART